MEKLSPQNQYIPTSLDKSLRKDDIPIEIMNLLFKTWLTSNCLSLSDRVSMSVGVETRLPLLDVKFVEKVIGWRRENADHRLGQKATFRDMMVEDLPQKTIKRRKSGFVPPVNRWIESIAENYGENLLEGNLVNTKVVDKDRLEKHLNIDNSVFQGQSLYRLILLELWYSLMIQTHKKTSGIGN